MARKSVKRHALRYTILAGLPSGVLILALAIVGGVPPLLASFALALVGGILSTLIVGATEAGLDTAATGAHAGFMDGSDVSKYQPDGVQLPGLLAIVCWLVGLAIVGIAAVAYFN